MHNLFVTTNHDNSLLVLKMSFQVFSLVSKNIQLFSSGKKILMLLLSVLFYLSSQFFEILIFSQDIYRNILYVSEIKHFLRNSDKISWAKQIKRNLRYGFV